MVPNIRLRPLQSGDYAAIAAIAQRTPGFTVPTKYMVWMLATTQGDFCRVAVDPQDAVIGYTLGMRTSDPAVGFSWQTAVLPDARSQRVAAALVAEIARAGKAHGISLVRFTSTVEQAAMMANLVRAAGIGEVTDTTAIPTEWGIEEVEVHLRLT